MFKKRGEYEKRKKTCRSKKYPAFLRVYPEDVNLKFIFDNLRNYGIASVMFYTGILIFKDGGTGTLLQFQYVAGATGIIIMFSAFILAVLNFIQGCIAMLVAKAWSTIPYLLIALLLHAVLFEAFFKRALFGN